ncbi:MAG: hypothetical protein CSB47_10390 [Proteobacteria bacterium]|nr:MAG: hypothetical protein CSB47_10390 [Pseudomonadota bacterium]
MVTPSGKIVHLNETPVEYFVYDPSVNEFITLDDPEKRDREVEGIISSYLAEPECLDGIDEVVIGEITGRIAPVSIYTPAGNLDEDNCEYKIMPLNYRPDDACQRECIKDRT